MTFLRDLFAPSENILKELLQNTLATLEKERASLLLKIVHTPLTPIAVKKLLLHFPAALPLLSELLGPLESYRPIFQSLFEGAILEKNEKLALLIYRFFQVNVGYPNIAAIEQSIGRKGPLWQTLFPPGSEEKLLPYTYFRMGGLS